MSEKILEIIKSYSSIIDLDEEKEVVHLVADIHDLMRETDLFKIRNSVNKFVRLKSNELTTKQSIKLLEIENDLSKIISGAI